MDGVHVLRLLRASINRGSTTPSTVFLLLHLLPTPIILEDLALVFYNILAGLARRYASLRPPICIRGNGSPAVPEQPQRVILGRAPVYRLWMQGPPQAGHRNIQMAAGSKPSMARRDLPGREPHSN